jgi:hypothetical protein
VLAHDGVLSVRRRSEGRYQVDIVTTAASPNDLIPIVTSTDGARVSTVPVDENSFEVYTLDSSPIDGGFTVIVAGRTP